MDGRQLGVLLAFLISQDVQHVWDQRGQVLRDGLFHAICQIHNQADSHSCHILILRLLQRIKYVLSKLANGHTLFQSEADTLVGDQSGFCHSLMLLEHLHDE